MPMPRFIPVRVTSLAVSTAPCPRNVPQFPSLKSQLYKVVRVEEGEEEDTAFRRSPRAYAKAFFASTLASAGQ